MNIPARYQSMLFGIYSYFKELETFILNLVPIFLRVMILRLIFKELGKRTQIDHGFYYRYGKKISIGDSVEINRNCSFYPSYHSKAGRIIIGNNVKIAPNVSFFCAGHSLSLDRGHKASDITIGNNVYIGANSVIRYGVVIGDNATIAIGSVVIDNVLPNQLVGGNPASPLSM